MRRNSLSRIPPHWKDQSINNSLRNMHVSGGSSTDLSSSSQYSVEPWLLRAFRLMHHNQPGSDNNDAIDELRQMYNRACQDPSLVTGMTLADALADIGGGGAGSGKEPPPVIDLCSPVSSGSRIRPTSSNPNLALAPGNQDHQTMAIDAGPQQPIESCLTTTTTVTARPSGVKRPPPKVAFFNMFDPERKRPPSAAGTGRTVVASVASVKGNPTTIARQDGGGDPVSTVDSPLSKPTELTATALDRREDDDVIVTTVTSSEDNRPESAINRVAGARKRKGVASRV